MQLLSIGSYISTMPSAMVVVLICVSEVVPFLLLLLKVKRKALVIQYI